MSYCRSCGGEVNADAVACTHCGVKPNNGNEFCQSCGKETNPKAVICVSCGVKLSSGNSISLGGKEISFGEQGGSEPNASPVDGFTAILWWLCCAPIGYMQWGQTAKGWLWLVIVLITGGFAGIICLVDYIMCFSAQKNRKLGEWEFFPR